MSRQSQRLCPFLMASDRTRPILTRCRFLLSLFLNRDETLCRKPGALEETLLAGRAEEDWPRELRVKEKLIYFLLVLEVRHVGHSKLTESRKVEETWSSLTSHRQPLNSSVISPKSVFCVFLPFFWGGRGHNFDHTIYSIVHLPLLLLNFISI